jgi:hypothetical protein
VLSSRYAPCGESAGDMLRGYEGRPRRGRTPCGNLKWYIQPPIEAAIAAHAISGERNSDSPSNIPGSSEGPDPASVHTLRLVLEHQDTNKQVQRGVGTGMCITKNNNDNEDSIRRRRASLCSCPVFYWLHRRKCYPARRIRGRLRQHRPRM